jgi:predicted DNA-binding protein
MVVALRQDQEEHLKLLCEQMGRSVDDFVREAVLTFMEDYEDGRDAEAVHGGGSEAA